MSAPRRRWLRFSLRTLFVVVTVVACWLGYNIHWIQQRRAGQTWIRDHTAWATGLVIGDPDRHLPWSLAVLGEKSFDRQALVARQGSDRYDPAAYRKRLAEIQELFPECAVADLDYESWTEGE